MAGLHGVQETKEAILALVVIGKFVADRLKDGVQLDDGMALLAKLVDEEFKAVVEAGVKGVELVPVEMGEIDLGDVLELAKVIPDVVAKIQA